MPMDKKFNAAEAEARITAAWQDSHAFAAGANASRDESFSIMIPPPNVTGALHVGHAFNNTLQDILIRWHRMRGFKTLWQPGQDHAGIATQLQVEKMLAAQGLPGRRDLGREDFLAKVWEWKGEYGGTIVEQLKRLGCSCDWDRNAFTMAGAPGDPRTGHENSPNFHDAVIKVFVEMYEKGFIYRGKRLTNWDPHFETAISDLEVENIETPGHMWHFKYPLAGGGTYEYVEKDEDGNVTLRETRDYISIATTRPETMLGDGAVAVHPSDARYAPIVGKLCEIPVGPKEHRRLIPIITDEYPDKDFGSGAVKITGAHDFNDYAVAKRGDIPCYRLMDTRAGMRDDGVPYAEAAAIAMAVAKGERSLSEAEVDAVNLVPDHLRGLDRFEARARVVEEITAEGLAVMTSADDPRLGAPSSSGSTRGPLSEENPDQVGDDGAADASPTEVPLVEAKPIMQPFGDRSKVVIEPMLTDQWFVDAEKIVGPALEAVRSGEVKIMPESGEKVYFHWLENIEPWCISRQLWWGHQIPVWYGPHPDHLPIMEKHLRLVRLNAADPSDAKLQEQLQRSSKEVAARTAYFDGAERIKVCAATAEEALEKAKVIYGADLEVGLADPEQGGFHPENSGRMVQTSGLYWQDEEDNWALKGISLVRDADVLDTWFSSGLWPIGTLGWPEQTEEYKTYFPTDVLITGQDILFFWVARMMMMQLAVVDSIPFHTVYLHQLVRDEKGKKMSKTTGNVIDPLEIVDEYGADALRFTNASMASIGGVLKLSKDRIAGYRNFGTKLWNACRFAEMNGAYEGETTRPDACAETVNRWIIGETAKTREVIDEALHAYRFNDAASALYSFVWGTVCDWYVELSKPLLLDGTDAQKTETRQTMAWVLDQCLLMAHPFMPFITEELWGTLASRQKMLVHGDWPDYAAADLTDEAASREMNWVISLIESVRSARGEMHVPVGLKVHMQCLELSAAGQTAWDNNETMIKRLARIESLTPVDTLPKGSVTITVEGATFCLPLADLIDVDEEKARLEKAMGKLAKDLGGLRGRLNNPKFVASAPDEVVAENRELLSQKEAEETKLKAALARLVEIG